jgi:hypothetical protein
MKRMSYMREGDCTHIKEGRWLFVPSGRMLDTHREYICDGCGLVHLASPEEVLMNSFHLKAQVNELHSRSTDEEIFAWAMKKILQRKCMVFTKKIKHGENIGVIRLPKPMAGHTATVIIWTPDMKPLPFSIGTDRGDEHEKETG